MAIALTLMRQRNAVSAQRSVTDTTNELLTQNASMLKENAIETAAENERGIVDIETLKTTQNDIIETIEQTLQIQEDGRQKRQVAEKELNELEQDLKQHLLAMVNNKTLVTCDLDLVNHLFDECFYFKFTYSFDIQC